MQKRGQIDLQLNVEQQMCLNGMHIAANDSHACIPHVAGTALDGWVWDTPCM